MGDLSVDTTVVPTGEAGHFRADLCSDWALLGPNGGYLAAVALRAAQSSTPLDRPVSLSCQFVQPARFGPVSLQVTTLRATRRAAALSVSLTQFDRPILQALVWAARDGLESPEAAWTPMPDVPGPEGVEDLKAHLEQEGRGVPPWHDCVTLREVTGRTTQLVPQPRTQCWGRFEPRAVFDDPWVDACRPLILIDSLQWPAVMNAYPELERTLFAPSIDLYVSFHTPTVPQEWLLADAGGRSAAAGVFGGSAHVWGADGTLVASGMQQMLSTSSRRMERMAPTARA